MSYETKSQLTKQALAEAFKRLIQTKNFQHITIGDITREAGFNRQTFYYHFKDIYDLLSWGFAQEMSQLIPYLANSEQNTWREALTRVMSYFSRNKYLCTCIINGIGHEQLMLALHDSICGVIRQIITHESDLRPVPPEHLDFTVEFYANAIGNCLYNWIRHGLKESPEEMLNHFDFVLTVYQNDITNDTTTVPPHRS